MAGIYIHVPYCKTRCIYCDFFTQTNSSSQSKYVEAVCKEMALRKEYIANSPIKTIYFGGGTPSQLCESELRVIFEAISNTFEVVTDAEITIECNPDDLTDQYLTMLATLPFNRMSIGIQSFDDYELKFLNRRHDAAKAIQAVQAAQEHGFTNISIDLIYGLPHQSMHIWEHNMQQAIALDIPHISSYHLIYEKDTKLYRLFTQGKVRPISEKLSVDMFSTMITRLGEGGYEHYEISNFAKDGKYSKHNTSYWLGEKYLGLGPAAHSFDGVDRAWNIASIGKYIEGIDNQLPNTEVEKLDMKSQYNDFVLTGLRTKWGVDLSKLEERFGSHYLEYFTKNIGKHISSGMVIKKDNILTLNKEGIFLSDGIMSDLMYID